MTWANFYFFCFLVGFFWAVVSLLLGHLHVHFPFLPHGDLHHGGGHVHLEISPSSSHGVHSATAHGDQVSPLNFGSIAAFMAWFGGVGFLLTAYSKL